MEAPDKIYIQPNAHDRWFEGNKPNDNFVEYVRKDALVPDNLDDAAEESMPEEEGFLEIDIYGGSEAVYSREQMLAMFKAGAEWMAEQGLISEGIIYQTSGKDTTIELNEHISDLEDCDEVIVKIRKRDE